MVFNIYLVVHIILCSSLIGLVLLQQGRGADLGAAFSGASNTIFGAGGADRLIVRLTTVIAILLMVSTVVLVNAFSNRAHSSAPTHSSELVSEIVEGSAQVSTTEQTDQTNEASAPKSDTN